MWLILAICAAAIVIPACSTSPELARGTGTILAADTGLGCTGWWLENDSGRVYEPTSLDEAFQTSGLRARFTLRVRHDMASGCMVGQIAGVVWLTRL